MKPASKWMVLVSIAWSVAEVLVIVAAVQLQNGFAGNIVRFWAGLSAASAVLLMSSAAAPSERRPKWVLRFLNVMDTAGVVLLAGFGWWWCATGFLLGAACCVRKRELEQETKAENAGGQG